MTIGDTFRHLGFHAADDPRPDAELVGRFVRSRDEPAFAELFRRHGPTVYGVCRRVLGNTHDADDAFQAVFLVLARKADTVRPPGMVGPWLYGVAVRTANKARVMNAKRAKRTATVGAATARERGTETPLPGGRGSQETLELIDAELASLPAVYRAVFVACEINGRSRSQAARDLGWPEGTVAARLAKARELLAARLTRRGVTLSAGLFAAAGVPAALAADTLGAVRELLAAGVATSVAPAAQTLSDEVVKSMSGVKLKLLAVAALVVGLTAGTVLLAGPGEKPGPRPERTAKPNAPVPKPAEHEWKEGKPIEFADGGRVTGVAFAPSGKTLAVCRDEGRIDFFDPATRKHQQGMVLKHDPKVNPNTEVGTVTAIAFRPTPHPKLGDVFAVTHMNGVNFGTVNIGLLVDNSAAVEGIPPNWEMKGGDPLQVLWPADHYVVASNGVEKWTREEIKGKWSSHSSDNENGERGRPLPLATLPESTCYLAAARWKLQRNDVHAVPTSFVASSPAWKLVGHKARPVVVAAAADGKRIVSADEGGTLIVWEGEKFEEKRRIEQGPGLAALALAPDGKTVAVLRTAGLDKLGPGGTATWFGLHVFDVTDPPAKPNLIWATDKHLDGEFRGPASLAFSPDGKTLLAAFADPYTDDKDAKSVGVKVWERVPKK